MDHKLGLYLIFSIKNIIFKKYNLQERDLQDRLEDRDKAQAQGRQVEEEGVEAEQQRKKQRL
jgi:hypothetical protein